MGVDQVRKEYPLFTQSEIGQTGCFVEKGNHANF